MSRPSTSTVVVLALLAACGGKTLSGGDQGSQTGGAGQAGTGSGTFSSGSGTGSSGTGTGSSGTATGTGSSGTGISVTGAGGGSVQCGVGSCPTGWSCCDPSCGSCVPPGSLCVVNACGSAGAFGQGGAFIGAGGTNVGGCVPPPPSKPGFVASEIISDLEDGPVVTGIVPGGGWFAYQDAEVGTFFSPAPNNFTTEAPGLAGNMAVHVVGKGFMPPESATNFGGGVGVALSMGPVDLSANPGITFLAKAGTAGIGIETDINVQIGTTDTDPTYCTCLATNSCYNFHSFLVRSVPPGATRYTVRWSDLHQADFSPKIPFDPKHVLTITFASNGPVPYFDYWVDDLRLAH